MVHCERVSKVNKYCVAKKLSTPPLKSCMTLISANLLNLVQLLQVEFVYSLKWIFCSDITIICEDIFTFVENKCF